MERPWRMRKAAKTWLEIENVLFSLWEQFDSLECMHQWCEYVFWHIVGFYWLQEFFLSLRVSCKFTVAVLSSHISQVNSSSSEGCLLKQACKHNNKSSQLYFNLVLVIEPWFYCILNSFMSPQKQTYLHTTSLRVRDAWLRRLAHGPRRFVIPCERLPERSRQSVPRGFRGVSLGGQHGHPGDKCLPLSLLRRCSQ